MVQIYLLASLVLMSAVAASPISTPVGNAGKSILISEDGQVLSFNGQKFSLKNSRNNRPKGQGHQSKCQTAPMAAVGPKALYFISNTAVNEVVALKIATNGTISQGSVTCTGGAGGTGVDAAGLPAVPDSLFSQGAVKVAGNVLVAVNSGSNTISMFNIDSADPTKLTMVGKPVDTLGDFPVSVALSSSLNMACVANSGAKAGIACFSMNKSTGLTLLDTALRSINLGQTTPPVGPTNTISHTFFNEDSTALLTTVKGDPATKKSGFISVYPVISGTVSTVDTRSSPAGTAVLFGAALIPGSPNKILVTDASFGSATLEISANNTATISSQTKIADQAATCWATFSDVTKTGFVTDVAVNHLVEVDTTTGAIVATLKSTNGNPGMIDLVSAGKFIYALSPGNNSTKAAVAVFDVSGGRGTAKEIQNFHPNGVTATAMGMTFA